MRGLIYAVCFSVSAGCLTSEQNSSETVQSVSPKETTEKQDSITIDQIEWGDHHVIGKLGVPLWHRVKITATVIEAPHYKGWRGGNHALRVTSVDGDKLDEPITMPFSFDPQGGTTLPGWRDQVATKKIQTFIDSKLNRKKKLVVFETFEMKGTPPSVEASRVISPSIDEIVNPDGTLKLLDIPFRQGSFDPFRPEYPLYIVSRLVILDSP